MLNVTTVMIGSGCIQAQVNVIDDDGLSWYVASLCVVRLCFDCVEDICAVSVAVEILLSFWFCICVCACFLADHRERHDLTKLLFVHPH